MEAIKAKDEKYLYVLIVILSVYRFSYYGFIYTPYLDDYVQYSYYPSLPEHWQRVYVGGTGVLFSRPLAGILDLVLWSKFYNNLGVAVFILAILHGISAILFYKAFQHLNVRMGVMFFAVYVFLPINIEATYWVSAATRLVVSMFLISMAMDFCVLGKKIAFAVFTFLSMWFYEQTAVLSMTLLTIVCIMKGKCKQTVVPITAFLSLLSFYIVYSGLGDNAERLSLTTFIGVFENIIRTANSFWTIFVDVLFKIISIGFLRGFTQLVRDFSLLWIGVLCVALIWIARQNYNKADKLNIKKCVLGIILAVIPLLPFAVARTSFLNLRNIYPCMLGIALVADELLTFFTKRFSNIISAFLILVFCISTVSEVRDYNYTASADLKTATQIAEIVAADTKDISVKIALPTYYTQNAPYGDHIMSMTGSDWGVTGIVRSLSKNAKLVVRVR